MFKRVFFQKTFMVCFFRTGKLFGVRCFRLLLFNNNNSHKKFRLAVELMIGQSTLRTSSKHANVVTAYIV